MHLGGKAGDEVSQRAKGPVDVN